MSSLDSSFQGSLFRPSSKRKGDGLFKLGWEHVPFQNLYEFRIENLQYATAEGIVTLAAIIDCLRSGTGAKVDLIIDPKARIWSEALALDQLIDNRWEKSFPITAFKAGGCLIHPLWRYRVNDPTSCRKIAQRISNQVAHLLKHLELEETISIATAARTIFQEALLNIFEHAYDSQVSRIAFEAITVTPVPRLSELKKLAYVTEQESSWFANHAGLMLEVAIADYGRNVPSSLWAAYADEHPEDRERISKLRLGTRQGQFERASLHHKIVLWSFNHKSTRKRPEDFAGELARLNWRGLHRVLNTAVRFDGCVIMRSGQARSGYTSDSGKTTALKSTTSPQREFPGTSIVLRVPLSSSRSSKDRKKSTSYGPTISLYRTADASALPPDLTDGHGETMPVGIVHPFRIYREDELEVLSHIARSILPHIVTFHLFASFENPALAEQLQAFDRALSPQDSGVPRLVAFWSPGRDLFWKFIGLMPEQARLTVRNLEDHGVFNIPSDTESRSFAEQLAHAYPHFLEITNDVLRLKQFKHRLKEEEVIRTMQVAFETWATRTDRSWLFDQTARFVRLPTGRLIKRYVSLFKMLYSDDALAQALGWRFANIVRQLQREHPGLCIVTESEASYFIARILLQGQNTSVEINIGPSPAKHRFSRPTLVFADAIYKGETLNTLLRSLRICRQVVCCLDLRANPENQFGERRIPITSLLKLSFDPQEGSPTTTTRGTDILEVDRVTHVPVETPPTESFLLGTDNNRVFFINENPYLFRYGLHMSGGRLHVVSMKNEELFLNHREKLFQWIKDIVISQINAMEGSDQPRDIVFFTRGEATIGEIVKDLGKRLPSEIDGVGRVFSAVLPFVPLGQREVFGRPTLELFYGLHRLNPTDLLFELPKQYLAVYLDDACVTGRSLLNFLILISQARPEQLPQAVLAIPTLSRFSPAEEQFYSSVCRAVSPQGPSTTPIPFSFRPLFRVQVRSFEKLQGCFAYELASKMAGQAFLDDRLQKYVARVIQRLENSVSSTQRSNLDLPALQHPFFNGRISDPASVSPRAIRIRHLIALQEQNVGVLGELLHELLDAALNDDFTVLTVISLELNLLEVPPLQKECRADIVNLAMKALISKETSSEMKSDAICVLAMTGQELIRQMEGILPVIGDDPDLIDQFLLFLLTNVPRTNLWFDDLNNSLRNCATALSTEEYGYISGYVKSFFEIAEPLSVNSTTDAVRAIEKLVSETSYHGKGLSSVNAINNWLSKKERDRVSTGGIEVQHKLREAVSFVRKTVLFGLEGLFWWAEYENPNQGAALDFRNSRFQLIECLNYIESIADTLKTVPVGSDVVVRLENLWETLRKHSNRFGPEYFLSQTITSPETGPSILEKWMPEFFCMPFEMLKKLSQSYLSQVHVTNNWEAPGEGFTIVMATIPLSPMMQIFELLLSDMQNHGSKTDNTIHLALEKHGGANYLSINFQDRVRYDDAPGTGRSQSKVRAMSMPFGLEVLFDQPRPRGELYTSKILVPQVMSIKCY